MIWHNEIDPFAAAWSRELMAAGLIPHGEVDERSIVDVRPADLVGCRQCHFFAGISVWPYALTLAGWPGDREVWTGSCPCQPFSAAGKGAGFADERHLWPLWFHQIDQCRPEFVFGEQVASKDGLAWLDLVQADLEGAGYTVGALDICAAGFGAPHIRQRLWWVGVDGAGRSGLEGQDTRTMGDKRSTAERSGRIGGMEHTPSDGRLERRAEPIGRGTAGGCGTGGLADMHGSGRTPGREGCPSMGHGAPAGADRGAERMADTDSGQRDRIAGGEGCERVGSPAGRLESNGEPERRSEADRPGPTNGFWRDADWLGCRDGKWRPVEPGSFPLAHGAAARVGRLRGYGNAINAAQATEFIKAVMAELGIRSALEDA